MTRSLTAGMQTAVAAERSTIAHLLELNSSGGVTRLATTPDDVSWNGFTWVGIGGELTFEPVEERTEFSDHGVQVRISGVDQTVIAVVLGNHMRGRKAVLYLVHFDAAGAIVADPVEFFRGLQNSDWQIEERPATEQFGGGTAVVTTRLVPRLVELNGVVAVRTNLNSHRDFLRRAGFTGAELNDNFFQYVPELVNRPIHWGRKGPSRRVGGHSGELVSKDS